MDKDNTIRKVISDIMDKSNTVRKETRKNYCFFCGIYGSMHEDVITRIGIEFRVSLCADCKGEGEDENFYKLKKILKWRLEDETESI